MNYLEAAKMIQSDYHEENPTTDSKAVLVMLCLVQKALKELEDKGQYTLSEANQLKHAVDFAKHQIKWIVKKASE